VALNRRGSTLEIKVVDNGPGIPPEIGATMFDEEFTTKNPETHSGLGLSHVRRAVHALDGDVTAETTANGTSFVVVLPAAFESATVGTA
jgi:signal transduction histidine kinase